MVWSSAGMSDLFNPAYFCEMTTALHHVTLSICDIQNLLVASSLFSVFAIAYAFFIRLWLAPYRNLPGPRPSSWWQGSLRDMHLFGDWMNMYGGALRYQTILGGHDILVTDMKAVHHILSHGDQFIKPHRLRKVFGLVLGRGVMVEEFDHHKKLRRALSGPFGLPSTKAIYPSLFGKVCELRDKVATMIDEDWAAAQTEVNVRRLIDACNVDLASIFTFDYDLGTLANEESPDFHSLGKKVSKLLITHSNVDAMSMLVPQWRNFPSAIHRNDWELTRQIREELTSIVLTTKREMEQLGADNGSRGQPVGNDILSALISSNTKNPDDQLSTADMVDQMITTFLAAVPNTAAAATTALVNLSRMPAIQARLRAELLSVRETHPSYETLSKLPYLDNFIKESLRLAPPGGMGARCPVADTVVPLGIPVRGRDGTMMDSITIPKGTNITISSVAINRSKDTWGDDAGCFYPDRWDRKHGTIPSTWGNQMTFMYGEHNCIGYRLAIANIKALLFTLVRSFHFDRGTIAQAVSFRPGVDEDVRAKRMYLYVRHLKDEELLVHE